MYYNIRYSLSCTGFYNTRWLHHGGSRKRQTMWCIASGVIPFIYLFVRYVKHILFLLSTVEYNKNKVIENIKDESIKCIIVECKKDTENIKDEFIKMYFV